MEMGDFQGVNGLFRSNRAPSAQTQIAAITAIRQAISSSWFHSLAGTFNHSESPEINEPMGRCTRFSREESCGVRGGWPPRFFSSSSSALLFVVTMTGEAAGDFLGLFVIQGVGEDQVEDDGQEGCRQQA